MIHFHRYKYVGFVKAFRWLGGVAGGFHEEIYVRASECTVCGKRKAVK